MLLIELEIFGFYFEQNERVRDRPTHFTGNFHM